MRGKLSRISGTVSEMCDYCTRLSADAIPKIGSCQCITLTLVVVRIKIKIKPTLLLYDLPPVQHVFGMADTAENGSTAIQ